MQESEHFPFFIQLMGEAAWDAARERSAGTENHITLADVHKGIGAIREEILDFYRERYAEARTKGILPEAVAVSSEMINTSDKGVRGARLSEVLSKTHNPLHDINNLLSPRESMELLSNIGLIWETPEGYWEPGLPSLCKYIANRGTE